MQNADLYEIVDRVWPIHALTSEEQRDRNIEKWVRSVSYLGEKWLLAFKVKKK
jgi:hypothetical protein